jgi:type IV pilus assembly protein PilB
MEEVSLSMELHSEIVSRIKILTEMNLAEKRMPQDGRFNVKVRDKGLDLRVSTFPTLNGEKVVMRLLEKDALQPSLESIGFTGRNLEQFKRALKNPLGMIIISGPTGSGKTTTLYSAISTLNVSEINAVTIEDPVEYRLEGVQQLQVKEKIGLTFAAALRNILRQDPDVIMVGEIRDVETAQIAVRAALTGHVVLSTLHTNNAVGVVTRLLDMGIDGFLLRAALTMVMSQRLVRLICDKCRESVSGRVVLERLSAKNVTEKRIEELGLKIDPNGYYDMGRGCRNCRDTGYRGRHAVIEAVELDDRMKEIINMRPFDEGMLRQAAKDTGMVSLIEHGQSLVADGRTTYEEIIRVLGEY